MGINIKKTGKAYLLIVSALLLMWLLPRLYYIITVKSYSTPFTLYSCVVKDFVSLEDKSGKDYVFVDSQGQMYADSVLPFFYYRLLSSRGNVVEKIAGHEFTGEQIEEGNVIFSSSPKDVNSDRPNVYMLMESCPERLELEDPQYALVLRGDGLKIVEVEGNRYEVSLENAFAQALDSLGFKYPAGLVAGNPSTRKSYDEGYLITDADGDLFHLKMAHKAPVVERIDRGGVDISHLYITENANHATLGYIFDNDGKLFILDSLRRMMPTDVVVDVTRQDILIVGDVLNYTVRVSDSDGEDFWALNTGTFDTVRTFRRDYEDDEPFDLPAYLLPARLSVSTSMSSYITPRLVDFSWAGLGVDVVLIVAVIAVAALRRRKSIS